MKDGREIFQERTVLHRFHSSLSKDKTVIQNKVKKYSTEMRKFNKDIKSIELVELIQKCSNPLDHLINEEEYIKYMEA